MQQQIDAEARSNVLLRFERTAQETSFQTQAMADRARRYTQEPARTAARAERKDLNLWHDCQREVLSRLASVPNVQLRAVLARVPDVFEKFSDNFGQQIASPRDVAADVDGWVDALYNYVIAVVGDINDAAAGLPVNPGRMPPSMPFERVRV